MANGLTLSLSEASAWRLGLSTRLYDALELGTEPVFDITVQCPTIR